MNNQEAGISTREAAERLQVTARTVRKWIDMFEDYIQPDWNERGHYLLTEEGLKRLSDIQNRLSEPQKSMKQVRMDLIKEGKIHLRPDQSELTDTELPDETLQQITETLDSVGEMVEELFDRMDRLENHIFGLFTTLEEMEHKLVAVSIDSVSANEVQQMFDEVRKKQDQLRMELRNVTFTQRLTAATSEQGLLPRRQKKTRFFGLL
ncbi:MULTISPECIES: helix-turn-helix domain-containing protein [Thermoactinomyces]|jgi:DNA-binding transcriptional MerR regulator|uniref:MerR family transcriptional regulator n=1 Tax=Thermoactinomyces daqus TaxID=1329516 RepID=A0A7W1X8N5_9BACL|nr:MULTISPECIES: helix-turn-helix domain-containing protein [Thermoactinomyces]MBA4542117.1 MerR family transcriptional regulator [Thermoactinomyces daqus]MBH8598960.1 MerR family transcriptional regulator [Thermoactinomyces sp. CICC 10523]MBH8604946.1 MerR family transcriptional regulator [Thermoactinomyces sp. CICC 10522]MBH8608338.1 MerR family transcriptional regulator [Thermoactinomyces sp. CICC 10521]